MVAIEICAYHTRPEICSNCDAKKDNSNSIHYNCIFPYTYFTDISIPVGGMTDV